MLKLFSKYVSIGVVNTAIHWVCFAVMISLLGKSQAIANFVAFFVAVTFSFFANAKWTFKSKVTSGKYISFVVFMGLMAAIIGYMADILCVPPIITLVFFSGFSLVTGFLYSKFIIFRDSK